jgi:hypothetical protein
MTTKIMDILLFNEQLEKIGALVRTQDNRITSDPLFVVEKKVLDYGYEDGYEDGYSWIDFDNDHDEADPDQHENLDRLWESGDVPSGWRKVGYKVRWEFVTCCLTEQGCKDFLRINGHNVGEARIYAYSGWRNHEWQAIRMAFINGVSVECNGRLTN